MAQQDVNDWDINTRTAQGESGGGMIFYNYIPDLPVPLVFGGEFWLSGERCHAVLRFFSLLLMVVHYYTEIFFVNYPFVSSN